jgi:hypothetical protein
VHGNLSGIGVYLLRQAIRTWREVAKRLQEAFGGSLNTCFRVCCVSYVTVRREIRGSP